MLVGHYGAGLILKSANKKLNLGWIFLVTMLPDILLGIFVLLGIEKIKIPDNFAKLHYLQFDFPYSHGLTATVISSALILILVNMFWPDKLPDKRRVAVVLALAFLSHFLLDVIVHVPEIPLLGNNSIKIGLGMWRTLPLALTFELLISYIGLFTYLKCNKEKGIKSRFAITIIIVILSLFTLSQAFTPKPPANALKFMSIQWIVLGIGVSLLAFWFDSSRKILTKKVNIQG